MEHNAQRLALMEEVAFTYSFTYHISETRSLRLLTDLSSKSHELKVKAY